MGRGIEGEGQATKLEHCSGGKMDELRSYHRILRVTPQDDLEAVFDKLLEGTVVIFSPADYRVPTLREMEKSSGLIAESNNHDRRIGNPL